MPDAWVTSVNCAGGTSAGGIVSTRGASTTVSFTCTGARGTRLSPNAANPISASAPSTHSERPNAAPMRRSSASTSSSGLGYGSTGSLIGNGGCKLLRSRQYRSGILRVPVLALQIVDHHGFRGVIGCGIAHPVQGHGRVACIVIGLVARIQLSMLVRTRLVSERSVNKGKIVMRGQVFGIEGE